MIIRNRLVQAPAHNMFFIYRYNANDARRAMKEVFIEVASCVLCLVAEADTRVSGAHEISGHRCQQQDLLWPGHSQHVC